MDNFHHHSTILVTTIVQDTDALKKFHDERIGAVAEQLRSNPRVSGIMVVHVRTETATYLQSTIHWSELDDDDTDDGE